MGLMEWWHHEQHKADTSQLSGAIKQGAIQGLDVSDAVRIHAGWKERLFDYVNGTSREKLDETTVCRDDACSLGKWIYGDANLVFSELPEYHRLKAAHAAFHIAAGDVIHAVNVNSKEKAVKLLTEGPFSEHSREVQLMLARLYSKMRVEE